MKIDLHNHAFTFESSSEPEEVIESAIRSGLDGIAFTEHNSYSATERAEALREKYSGRIRIFRGAEYDAAEGHVLLFGLRDNSFLDIGMFAPLDELIRHIGPKGAVAVVAHPFRGWASFKSDLSKVKGICAIEAFNGNNSDEENEKAYNASLTLGLPNTGGSDSHSSDGVGRCYTEFLDEFTEDALAGALRSGRFRGVKGK
jgi:predicted metal-dependent phosphoesterase TrpH